LKVEDIPDSVVSVDGERIKDDVITVSEDSPNKMPV